MWKYCPRRRLSVILISDVLIHIGIFTKEIVYKNNLPLINVFSKEILLASSEREKLQFEGMESDMRLSKVQEIKRCFWWEVHSLSHDISLKDLNNIIQLKIICWNMHCFIGINFGNVLVNYRVRARVIGFFAIQVAKSTSLTFIVTYLNNFVVTGRTGLITYFLEYFDI